MGKADVERQEKGDFGQKKGVVGGGIPTYDARRSTQNGATRSGVGRSPARARGNLNWGEESAERSAV